jgi:putative sterol carrier protein
LLIVRRSSLIAPSTLSLFTRKIPMLDQLALQLQSLAQSRPAGRIFVQFDLGTDGGLYLDTRGDVPTVSMNSNDKPQTVMTLSPADLKEMLDGRLDPTKAFMTGRMQIDGEMSIAMKLAALFKAQ